MKSRLSKSESSSGTTQQATSNNGATYSQTQQQRPVYPEQGMDLQQHAKKLNKVPTGPIICGNFKLQNRLFV